ncbi:MAG TPA: hypothetical protein DCY74_08310 [Clostridiales bacterium]|nr:hypothetical protein [Clostridiales bacterium]
MLISSLHSHEFDAWVALCARGFQMPPDEFYEHFVYDPDAVIEGILVARDGKKLVSSVRVFHRTLYLEGHPIPAGAIGEVCTLPAYRGKGLSGILLQNAIRYMEKCRMPLSTLITDIPAYYQKFGWLITPRGLITLPLIEYTLSLSLRPFLPEDLPAVLSLCSPYNGLFLRSESYWNSWMPHNTRHPAVAVHNGTIVAYLDYAIQENTLLFREYRGDPARIAEVFSLVGDYTEVKNVPFSFCPDPALPVTEDTTLMVRLNFPFTCGNTRVDHPSILASLYQEPVFFTPDNY